MADQVVVPRVVLLQDLADEVALLLDLVAPAQALAASRVEWVELQQLRNQRSFEFVFSRRSPSNQTRVQLAHAIFG